MKVKRMIDREFDRTTFRDPTLDEVLHRLEGVPAKKIAELSRGWIGASTIWKWRKEEGGTRMPANYTLVAAMEVADIIEEQKNLTAKRSTRKKPFYTAQATA